MKSGTGFNLLNRMRLSQKFLLLGLIAFVATLLPFYRYFSAAQDDIAFARSEQTGIPPINEAIRLIQLLQQHRGLSSAVLAGDQTQAQALAAKNEEVNRQIAEVDRQLTTVPDETVKNRWSRIKQDWTNVTLLVATHGTEARASLKAHTDLVDQSLVLVEVIADWSKLSLDPYAHTYFLMQTMTNHLPRLAESLGLLRGLGAGRLAEAERLRKDGGNASQALTAADRLEIEAALRRLHATSDDTYRFVDKAMHEETRIAGQLSNLLATPKDASRRLEELIRKEILDAPTLSMSAATYIQTFTGGIDEQYKFQSQVTQSMQKELDLVVSTKRTAELVISLEILGAMLLALIVGVLIVRNVSRTVAGLKGAVTQVRAGNETALQDIDARDEIGDLGRTVNLLLSERITAQRSAEAENDRLNNSVIEIMQSLAQLSQRDLTVKVPVTADVTGAISDAINMVTTATHQALRNVSNISNSVAQASNKVKNRSEQALQVAQTSGAEAVAASQELATAARALHDIAEQAQQANKSAERAIAATGEAMSIVRATVDGISLSRDQIRETEKRVKRLGERSQEISSVVNIIGQIAERTSVLALNASMQAVAAGDAGRGFAVVADEVKRLAENARQATQQIASLVSAVQADTIETAQAMNLTITQVVDMSKLAERAGGQMQQTRTATEELVNSVRGIVLTTETQAKSSDILLARARQLVDANQKTMIQLGEQREDTDNLLGFSKGLLDTVQVFRLPAVAV